MNTYNRQKAIEARRSAPRRPLSKREREALRLLHSPLSSKGAKS